MRSLANPGGPSNQAEQMSWLFGQLLQAVDDELAAILSQAHPIRLENGRLVQRKGDRYTYEFTAKAGVALRIGPPAELRIGAVSYIARLQPSTATGAVVLTLQHDVGAPQKADLRIDETYMWRRMRPLLETLQHNTDGFNVDFMARMARLDGVAPPCQVEDLASAARLADLEPSQQDAVRTCLRYLFAFIWGPPGTGKTEVEAEVTAALARQRRTVLVLCPSHNSLNLLVKRVLKRLRKDDASYDILRHGQIAPADLEELQFIDRRSNLKTHKTRIDTEITEINRELGAVRDEAQKLRVLLDSADCPEDAPANLVKLENDEVTLTERRQACRGDLQRLGRDLVQNSQVVFATLAAVVINEAFRVARFDALIVDEASMAGLAQLLPTIGMARERVVIAGDFRQLSAVAKGQSDAVRTWIRRTAFDSAGVVEAVNAGRLPPHLAVLDTQHRMHPDIADVINAIAYPKNPLKTGLEVFKREPSGCPWGEGGLFYVDTSRLPLSGPAARHANQLHADLILDLLRSPARPTLSRIGIATPYRNEAALIQQALAGAAVNLKDVVISTVHSYQGAETDTVIVDLPDDGTPGRIAAGFLRGYSPQDEATRLLNVAISRAKRRVILLGHFDYLCAVMEGTSLSAVIELFRERGRGLDRADLAGLL